MTFNLTASILTSLCSAAFFFGLGALVAANVTPWWTNIFVLLVGLCSLALGLFLAYLAGLGRGTK